MDHKDQVKWLRFLKFLQEKNSCPLYEGVKTEIRGSHLIKYSEGLMGGSKCTGNISVVVFESVM